MKRKFILVIAIVMSILSFNSIIIKAHDKEDFIIIEEFDKEENIKSKERKEEKDKAQNKKDKKQKKEENSNSNNKEAKDDDKKSEENKENKKEDEEEEKEVENVKYNVMFKSFWCKESHEKDYPEGAKFSDFVGIVHNKKAKLWKENGSATDGFKKLIEDAKPKKIGKEIKRGIQIGTIKDKFYLKGVSECKGSSTIDIEVNELYPFVSIAGKISPSPDWFTGVSNVCLFQNGKWIDKKIIIVYAYDGGTREGGAYTEIGKDTEPHDKITKIEKEPFIKKGELVPIGSFVFVKDTQ